MKVIDVIPYSYWRNTKSGATASIRGAVPYDSDSNKQEWVIETKGWTWVNSNGTTGLGRVPASTQEEAILIMEKINNRYKTLNNA